MAKTLGPDETYFQLATAKWRHKALKVLAAQNGTTMNAEVEAAIDARLGAADLLPRDGETEDGQ